MLILLVLILSSKHKGWWNEPVPSSDDRCHPERKHRDRCHHFVPCEPKDACIGNNECQARFTGYRCSLCAEGYYRVAGDCEECPNNPGLILAFFVAGMVFLAMAAYALQTIQKKGGTVSSVAIGVDYYQVLSMFMQSKVAWPPIIKRVLRIFSFFNFNIEITAPECLLDWSFKRKWIMTELIPVRIISLFFFHYFTISFDYVIFHACK